MELAAILHKSSHSRSIGRPQALQRNPRNRRPSHYATTGRKVRLKDFAVLLRRHGWRDLAPQCAGLLAISLGLSHNFSDYNENIPRLSGAQRGHSRIAEIDDFYDKELLPADMGGI